MTLPSAHPMASQRGFVIVAVLWILMALSSLAMIFALYLSASARAMAVGDAALQNEALASAGVELTAYQLILAGDDRRPARGSFRFRMDDADVNVNFTSEAARIDLNFAPKEVLAAFFAGLGAGRDAAMEDAERIVAWRTRPVPGGANDEEAHYAALGYSPRQSLFTHVNELALIAGLSPALVDRALPFMTVFNGSSDVDATIAAPEVMAAFSKGGNATDLACKRRSIRGAEKRDAHGEKSLLPRRNDDRLCQRSPRDFRSRDRARRQGRTLPRLVLAERCRAPQPATCAPEVVMAIIADVKQFLAEWIDAVSRAVDAVAGRFVRSQRIRLVEGEDGAFTASAGSAKSGIRLPDLFFHLESGTPLPPLSPDWKAAFRGSRIEAQLRPDRIMTHRLDFPGKAADFLDGMIRAQIDRLTPWTVNDAVFGWSSPAPAPNDRIEVIFAATSKQKVNPLRRFAEILDAASIAIFAPVSDGTSASITLIGPGHAQQDRGGCQRPAAAARNPAFGRCCRRGVAPA